MAHPPRGPEPRGERATARAMGDVLGGGEERQQVAGGLLEDEPDGVAAVARALTTAHREQVVAGDSRRPAVGTSSPDRIVRSVDLPEPDAPTIAVSSPASISRLSPWRACTSTPSAEKIRTRSTQLI